MLKLTKITEVIMVQCFILSTLFKYLEIALLFGRLPYDIYFKEFSNVHLVMAAILDLSYLFKKIRLLT